MGHIKIEISPLAAQTCIDIQCVRKHPHQDVSDGREIKQDANRNHKIVKRKDTQEAPDVELPRRKPFSDGSVFDGVTRSQQYAANQEAAQNKEEFDTQLSPWDAAQNPGKILNPDKMLQKDSHHGQGA